MNFTLPDVFLYRMPNDKLTFAEYYEKKYGVSIEDPSQPLLRLSNARARDTIQQMKALISSKRHSSHLST